MNSNSTLLNLAKQVQALSEIGKHYADSDYDLDRYSELEEIALQMISLISDADIETLKLVFSDKNGYRTPKVDVRAVVFNEADEILMIREKIDGKWSLPGGWADIGFTPAEIAVKETREEAGITVEAEKVLAILDKRCHKHPDDIYYVYKIFIQCKSISNMLNPGYEASDAGFFPKNRLPALSTPRNTMEQMELMFSYREGKLKWPSIDINNND